MATKKFTKHAQRVLSRNPNVVRCTEGKITFTEDKEGYQSRFLRENLESYF